MNAHFQSIGEEFVRFYYSNHDNAQTRRNLLNLYDENALLTYEGDQRQGKNPIMEKLMAGPTQMAHEITKIDCQPLIDGGILASVIGQMKAEGESIPLSFTHIFVLKPANNQFYIQHEMFRLCLHNC
ncbi:Nuclear transport factor 2 [Mactra antiquata]